MVKDNTTNEQEPRRPLCDIYELESEVVAKIELPQIQEENIKINIDEKYLTIIIRESTQTRISELDHIRIERITGSFSKSFRLPTEINKEYAEARFDNGILEIHMPKIHPVEN
ncbi:MAG: Hsp20/alpha crystallin family protein [Nanoarchaeota archaeon]